MPNVMPWPADTQPAQGAWNQVPADTSQILESSFNEAGRQNPVESFNRLTALAGAENDPTDNIVDGKTLSERYGLDGQLKFTGSMREGAAKLLFDRKLTELEAKDTLARGDGSFISKAAGTAGGIAGFFSDPINAASLLVPLGGGATSLPRLAVQGAVAGAVASVATEPITYAAQEAEQADYSLQDSFQKAAWGAIGGAILAPLGHLALAGYRNVRADVLEKLNLGTTEAAMQAALGDMAMGEPPISAKTAIEVDPAIAAEQIKASRGGSAETPNPTDIIQEPSEEEIRSYQQQKLDELQATKSQQLDQMYNGDPEFKKELFNQEAPQEIPVDQRISDMEKNMQEDPLHEEIQKNDPEALAENDAEIQKVKDSEFAYRQVGKCWELYGAAL